MFISQCFHPIVLTGKVIMKVTLFEQSLDVKLAVKLYFTRGGFSPAAYWLYVLLRSHISPPPGAILLRFCFAVPIVPPDRKCDDQVWQAEAKEDTTAPPSVELVGDNMTGRPEKKNYLPYWSKVSVFSFLSELYGCVCVLWQQQRRARRTPNRQEVNFYIKRTRPSLVGPSYELGDVWRCTGVRGG